MKQLVNDIKNKDFKKVYLLFGEEDYLKSAYAKQMIEAVTDGNNMNETYYNGNDIDVNELVENAKSSPFFAEKKIIVAENTNLFSGEGEPLAEFLPELPESTVMVLLERTVDKRTKLYKAVKEAGYIAEINKQAEDDISVWAAKLFAKSKKRITKADMSYLIAMVGVDMEVLSNEIEKLVCYCIHKPVIKKEDIDAVCSKQLSVRIFDLMDQMSYKNQKKALDCYYELTTDKNEPYAILRMISRQFNLLLQAKDLKNRGMSRGDIIKAMGQPYFVVDKCIKQSENFSIDDLKEGLKDSVETEDKIKKGLLDPNIGVELLIVKYSTK
ncbi:MAG: DNA polymerase III subunit delta [Eubacterium sp.]|nr:DNA polymerase III subunit delta [Eubacterium sp.]